LPSPRQDEASYRLRPRVRKGLGRALCNCDRVGDRINRKPVKTSNSRPQIQAEGFSWCRACGAGWAHTGVMSDWSDEETDDPIHAERRNFYKVEKWTRDEQRVVELLFAGSSLDKARRIFDRMTKHRCVSG
jgi:hypothetical protein